MWQEDEEEDVRSYWMTLRTGEDTLIRKRRLWTCRQTDYWIIIIYLTFSHLKFGFKTQLCKNSPSPLGIHVPPALLYPSKLFYLQEYILAFHMMQVFFLLPLPPPELCLALILLTWTIWRAPTNASKWRMGFISAFKELSLLYSDAVSWSADWIILRGGKRNNRRKKNLSQRYFLHNESHKEWPGIEPSDQLPATAAITLHTFFLIQLSLIHIFSLPPCS